MVNVQIDVKCSRCNELIVKAGIVTKVRNKIILIRDGRLFAVCKGCGKEIDLSNIRKKITVSERRIHPTIMVRKTNVNKKTEKVLTNL